MFASKVGDVRFSAFAKISSIFMHSDARASADMFSDSAFINKVGNGWGPCLNKFGENGRLMSTPALSVARDNAIYARMEAAGDDLSCKSPKSGIDARNVRPVAACMVELKSGVSGRPLRLMSI